MNPNELKSAEEWVKIQLTDKNLEFDKCKIELERQDLVIKFYKQIQLNAYRAGMTAAAEIVKQQPYQSLHSHDISAQDIISARDRKESL